MARFAAKVSGEKQHDHGVVLNSFWPPTGYRQYYKDLSYFAVDYRHGALSKRQLVQVTPT